MTIKLEVLAEFDEWMDFILAEYPSGQKNWQIIRDELLAMDASLADANALLSEIKEWDCGEAVRRFMASDAGVIFLLPEELRVKIQDHLSEPRT